MVKEFPTPSQITVIRNCLQECTFHSVIFLKYYTFYAMTAEGLQEWLKMYFTVLLFHVRTKTKDFYTFPDWQLIKSKSMQIPSGVFFVFLSRTASTIIHSSRSLLHHKGEAHLSSSHKTLSWQLFNIVSLQLFLFSLAFVFFAKAFGGAYMKSSITQIERRFDIPSSLTGVLDGSFEMGTCLARPSHRRLSTQWLTVGI